MPRVVPVSGDQRYWVDRDYSRAARDTRGGLLAARCGRAFNRTLPGGAIERVCPLASGAACRKGDRGAVSRLGCVAGTSRTGAAEVSLPAAWMDGGEFPGPTAAPDWISIRC